jgi:hypothetical protein
VVAAVKAAPGSILEGHALIKLPEFNALLRDESQFATVLKKARGLTSSGDAEMAEEAEFVVETIGKACPESALAEKAAAIAAKLAATR